MHLFLTNMTFLSPTRFPVATAILALSVSVAGAAFGTTVQNHHTSHTKAAKTHHTSVHHTLFKHTRHHSSSAHRHSASLGQRVMEPQRAMEIQQALIQAHY